MVFVCMGVCGGQTRGSDPLWLTGVIHGHWELISDSSPSLLSLLPLLRRVVISLTLFILFSHCPFLLPQGEDVEKILDEWKEYKMGVPTYGAIILDETLENVSVPEQKIIVQW